MATASRPTERYVEFDEYIDLQLDKARSGIRWTDILGAVAGVAALLIGYLVVFVAADHWLFAGGVPEWLRISSLSVIAIVSVLWIGWRVVWPYLRQVNELYAARMLEESEPGLRGSLFGLVDSRRSGRQPVEEVRRALEKRAATVLSDVDVDSSIDRRGLLRTTYLLLAVVLIACLYAVASPKRVGPSIVRGLLPTSSASVATRTEIVDVQPGDVSVLAGVTLDVSVMIRGEMPERVMLFYSTSDRRFADEPVEMRLHDETTREYRAALIGDAGRGLTQDLSYRIEANDDAAGPFQVEVEQPPVADVTSIAMRFPPYTRLEPVVRDVPPIEAIEGTTVTLSATANRPLKSAKLVFADDERFLARGEEIPMKVGADGVSLTVNWTLAIRSDGTSPTHYRIECRDEAGKTNPNPSVYPISIRPDLPPEVTLLDPKSDLERPANAIIPLLVTARDPDFGLRELTLRLERQGQELPERTVLWEGSDVQARMTYDWDLAPLGLKPGDVVTFYVQARDNREPEFNRRNTPKLNVTITEPVDQQQVEQQRDQDRQRQQQEMAEADRNQESADQEPQPAGDDANPMIPGEPTGDDQQQPNDQSREPQAGQPQAGDQQAPGESKNAGNNDSETGGGDESVPDDEALRKLLEHQRQQQDQPANAENEKSQPPQDDEQQNESQQNGMSEQSGTSKQGGKSDPQQTGSDGQSKQSQSSKSENGSTDGSSRQTSGEQRSSSGDRPQGTQNADGDSGSGQRETNGQRPDQSGTPSDDANESSDSGSKTSQEQMSSDGESTSMPPDGSTRPQQDRSRSTGDETSNSTDTSQMPDDRSSETDRPEETDSSATDTEGEPSAPGENKEMSDSTKSGSQPSQEDNKNGTPENGEQGDPSESDPMAKGEQPMSKSGSPDQTADEGMSPEEGQPATERKNDPQGEASQSQTGDSEQKSPRPQSGEPGQGEPSEEGSPSQQPGSAEQSEQQGSSPTDQPGDQKGQPNSSQNPSEGMKPSASDESSSSPTESSQSKTDTSEMNESEGQTGQGQKGEGQKGEGQKGEGQKGEGQKGEGQKGEGQKGEGQKGEGQKGEGQQGKGQQGDSKGGSSQGGGAASGGGESSQGAASKGASSNTPGGGQGTGGSSGGSHQGDSESAAEEANADYARQATDLALKRIEDELERGEVDPELLEELGWTEDDMRRFADRMRRNLSQPTGDETPQQISERKEFEHMLQNLEFGAGPASRTAPVGRVKDVGDVSTANPRVPSEYRDAYEAFTRSVAGRREAAEK